MINTRYDNYSYVYSSLFHLCSPHIKAAPFAMGNTVTFGIKKLIVSIVVSWLSIVLHCC